MKVKHVIKTVLFLLLVAGNIYTFAFTSLTQGPEGPVVMISLIADFILLVTLVAILIIWCIDHWNDNLSGKNG